MATDFVLCAFDRDLTRLFHDRFSLQPRRFPNSNTYLVDHDTKMVSFPLPTDHVVVVLEARGAKASVAQIAVTAHMPNCAGHGAVYLTMKGVTLRAQGSHAELGGSECTMPFPREGWTGALDRVDYLLIDGDGTTLQSSRAPYDWRPAGVATLALGLGAAIISSRSLRLASLLLFSRLVPPRLLEREARARIHAAIENDPGIHLAEIARRLRIGPTTAAYHARVLERERLIEHVACGGYRHYFLAARFAKLEKQVLAAARDPQLRTFISVASTSNDWTLTKLAQATGARRPAASKLLRRARRLDLVQLERHGSRLKIQLQPEAAPFVDRWLSRGMRRLPTLPQGA